MVRGKQLQTLKRAAGAAPPALNAHRARHTLSVLPTRCEWLAGGGGMSGASRCYCPVAGLDEPGNLTWDPSHRSLGHPL